MFRYNAKNCTIEVDSVFITGVGEDMVTFTKRESLAEDKVGAQGDVVRSEKNDPLYDCEITVQITSPQYGFLRSLKDRTEPFPLWINDKALGIKAGGEQALVNEVAELGLGAEADDATFKFTVYDGDIITD